MAWAVGMADSADKEQETGASGSNKKKNKHAGDKKGNCTLNVLKQKHN